MTHSPAIICPLRCPSNRINSLCRLLRVIWNYYTCAAACLSAPLRPPLGKQRRTHSHTLHTNTRTTIISWLRNFQGSIRNETRTRAWHFGSYLLRALLTKDLPDELFVYVGGIPFVTQLCTNNMVSVCEWVRAPNRKRSKLINKSRACKIYLT